MANLFESLESRTFLSSTLLATLKADIGPLKADVVAMKKEIASTEKTLHADLKAASLLKTDGKQLTNLAKDAASAIASINTAVNNASAVITRDASKLVADQAALAKKPTNTKLSAKVSADETALSGASTTLSAAVDSAGNGTNAGTDLTTIAGDGGQTATDANAALTAIQGDLQAIHTAAAQALVTDVNALLSA